MTEHYVQTVDVAIKSSHRKLQIIGTAIKLLSLGFILLAGFINVYFLFGFFGLLAIGITMTQFFSNAAKQFEYDFNTQRLVVSKTNNLNRRRRFVEIVFDDVTEYGVFVDLTDETDICACNNPQDVGTKYLLFTADGKATRLLFSPDEYLELLIKEICADKTTN